MSSKLVTQLSQTLTPAGEAQSAAAIQAAQSLAVALEARRMPEFSNSVCDAALELLTRGAAQAVEADTALREASARFARLIEKTRPLRAVA
jgi:hypothetical protein